MSGKLNGNLKVIVALCTMVALVGGAVAAHVQARSQIDNNAERIDEIKAWSTDHECEILSELKCLTRDIVELKLVIERLRVKVEEL